MWNVIREQLSYRRLELLALLVLASCIALVASSNAESAEGMRGVWTFVAVILGGGANLYLWTVDQRERRMLLWVTVPLTPRLAASARLVSTLIVQGAVSFVGISCLSAVLAAEGYLDLENATLALRSILGGQGVGLLAIGFVHFQEELNLHFSRSRAVVYTISALSLAFFAVLAFFASREQLSLEAWATIAGCHSLAAFAAGCAFALFLRRRNHLVGVDAFWGTPEDWSGTASRTT